MIRSATLLFILLSNSLLLAQEQTTDRVSGEASVWKTIAHESAASFRGVHVVAGSQSVWVSGSRGTVLNSPDGGESWNDVSPDGAEELDFRDVHGFSSGHAVALAVGSPGKIYRASDNGKRWEVVYQDNRPDIFLDAMSFWDDQNGIAFGDPIDGKIVVVLTSDGGKTWAELDSAKQPMAIAGEGGFAASGTCLCIQGDKVFIGLGGARTEGDPPNSRILMSADRGQTWKAVETPLKSAAASGVFSIAFIDDLYGVAVGGTYDNPEDTTNHVCVTEDGGQTWTRPEGAQLPRAYRSCVVVQKDAASSGPRLIAVGKTGGDYSDDMGRTWRRLSDQGFYAVDANDSGTVLVAVGTDGTIGVLPKAR